MLIFRFCLVDGYGNEGMGVIPYMGVIVIPDYKTNAALFSN